MCAHISYVRRTVFYFVSLFPFASVSFTRIDIDTYVFSRYIH